MPKLHLRHMLQLFVAVGWAGVNQRVPRPDDFREAAMGMFKTDEHDQVETVSRIRRLHQRQERGIRACIFILAFPVNCGIDCVRSNKHEQSWNVMHMLASMEKYFFLRYRYPVVIYHEDYTNEQKQRVANATQSEVFWLKISLAQPSSLPRYYDLAAVRNVTQASHRFGDLRLPSMRGAYHGFGYRMMCRFFGGLIFHSPLVREFEYYWRVDGGDSRLEGEVNYDLFAQMKHHDWRYGYRGIASSSPSPRLDATFAQLRAKLGLHPDPRLLRPFVRTSGAYNGQYYYNNFEVVHVPTFASKLHWQLFSAVDHSGAFMFGQQKKQSLGDADYRSVAVAYMLNASQVHDFSSVPYLHPVPWDKPYNVPIKHSDRRSANLHPKPDPLAQLHPFSGEVMHPGGPAQVGPMQRKPG